MKIIKEVTVFTNGDSQKLTTWSNVPYFFTDTLITKGIKVNRVDISPFLPLQIVYKMTFYAILKLLNRNTTYTYFRSYIHYINVRYRIKRALINYKDSDIFIFLTFSFSSAGLTKKPTILFCDWTYDHYFNYFQNRKPDILERSCIKIEDKQIEHSDLIFVLFPGVLDYMKSRYKNKNIFYIGNIINSIHDTTKSRILEEKSISNDLLFIGGKQYIEGAKLLINAYTLLKCEYPDLSLHIVGMQNRDFVKVPDGVHCYGYLDKSKDNERDLYYSLLIKSRLFINTTPKWGAFSATIEAMYFYNPIITTAYDEFVRTFGSNINFGYYYKNNLTASLSALIIKIFENESYETLCINAHNSVKDFTWSSYIDKMLNKINEIIYNDNTK